MTTPVLILNQPRTDMKPNWQFFKLYNVEIAWECEEAAAHRYFRETFNDDIVGMEVKLTTCFIILDPWTTTGKYDVLTNCKMGLILEMTGEQKVVKFLRITIAEIIVPLIKKDTMDMCWVVRALQISISMVEDNRRAERTARSDALLKGAMRAWRGLLKAITDGEQEAEEEEVGGIDMEELLREYSFVQEIFEGASQPPGTPANLINAAIEGVECYEKRVATIVAVYKQMTDSQPKVDALFKLLEDVERADGKDLTEAALLSFKEEWPTFEIPLASVSKAVLVKFLALAPLHWSNIKLMIAQSPAGTEANLELCRGCQKLFVDLSMAIERDPCIIVELDQLIEDVKASTWTIDNVSRTNELIAKCDKFHSEVVEFHELIDLLDEFLEAAAACHGAKLTGDISKLVDNTVLSLIDRASHALDVFQNSQHQLLISKFIETTRTMLIFVTPLVADPMRAEVSFLESFHAVCLADASILTPQPGSREIVDALERDDGAAHIALRDASRMYEDQDVMVENFPEHGLAYIRKEQTRLQVKLSAIRDNTVKVLGDTVSELQGVSDKFGGGAPEERRVR